MTWMRLDFEGTQDVIDQLEASIESLLKMSCILIS